MTRHGFHFSKSLGQNFLCARHVPTAIAQGAGIDENTGVLEVGKKADIIAIDLNRPHLCPNVDPLALMTYSAQGSDVVMTMVDGRILYENGEFLTLDADRILHDARACVARLYR